MKHFLKPTLLAVLASAALSSCVVPDPEYLQAMQEMGDTHYPASKIVGRWIQFSNMPYTYQATGRESRNNFEFRSNGTGVTQQHDKYVTTGQEITIQAPVRWDYAGNNWWNVHMPSADQYRILSTSAGLSLGQRPAYIMRVRYHRGRLYDTKSMQVMVSPEEAPSYIRLKRARMQAQASGMAPVTYVQASY